MSVILILLLRPSCQLISDQTVDSVSKKGSSPGADPPLIRVEGRHHTHFFFMPNAFLNFCACMRDSVVTGEERRKEMFYLMTHSTHFIYCYMALDGHWYFSLKHF